MNSHIINCDRDEFFNNFLPNGYLGVGLYLKNTTPQSLSLSCRASYSMYADMKAIRVGDIIFVHAGNKIYGAFEATSEFFEENIPQTDFSSKNIHYYPDPNNRSSGWQGRITIVPSLGYYRKIAIKPYMENGKNYCFTPLS